MESVDVDEREITVDPTSRLAAASPSGGRAPAATVPGQAPAATAPGQPPAATAPGQPPAEPAAGAPRIPHQPTGDTEAQAGGELAVDEGLTERDRQVLAFERQWWKHAGAKEQAIRDMFGLSSTRYYRMLNVLLDSPAALEYDPVLVARLRRLRATRSRARTGGRR